MIQTTSIPSASQIASSKTHLERRSQWRTVHIEGVRYIVMPSSCATSQKPPKGRKRVYTVRADGQGCDCAAYLEWNYAVCSHMLAVRESLNHEALQAWLDDQAEQPVGAATVAKAFKIYEELYGATCGATGCQDDALPREAEDDGAYCGRHQLAEVF